MKWIWIVCLQLLLVGNIKAQDAIPPHDSLIIASKLLDENRRINIWLPPQYKNATEYFPVLYMLDGGIQEDFPHIANTVADLIQSKKIQPVILVGIENTQRRRDLTGFTTVKRDKSIAPVVGGSEVFRNFIAQELFAIIDAKYRTQKVKSIIGESLAGLFIVETFLKYPELFQNYIAMDPSLWWNRHELVKKAPEYLSKMPANKKQLWFAGSGEKTIFTYTRKLQNILLKNKLPQLHWQYMDEPSEKHQTIFRATKEKALIWSLGQAL
ncbi:MAG: alpha/beta hydrolase [Chitinophagaceae bacterium]|nr:MAG: alpha/beta hydrolase [Chitinophagaceae bacterium]